MGYQYGSLLKEQLHNVLEILIQYFIVLQNVEYSQLVQQANLFYERYSYSYQLFLEGVSQGSGLTLDDCKILNAMETLDVFSSSKFSSQLSACAFLALPASKTRSQYNLIGRNYDYNPIYGEIAKDYLNVIQLNDQNGVTSYIVGMIGQIYCPSCVSDNGIFMELNNGMPSGGTYVEQERQTLLINLLHIIQNSAHFAQADKQLMATQSDYSLIINMADHQFVKSYEYSSSLGMKPFSPALGQPFASTNYYQNSSWVGIPPPTDDTTWIGVTRRQNLLNLANSREVFGILEFQELMDTWLENGGAKWNMTIYQMIFDSTPQNLTIYLKPSFAFDATWTKVPLGSQFQELFLSSE
mmetsp:Transcript_2184/g.2893  ORF Transcript_2184/g.2893 Transcript_2184/m.2893 type:complete len:354 (+) Transcript_2184:87-1148(+)